MSFLEHIVLHHLSNPGVYSGLRMKPERELAKLLNVSHHEVRRALERVEHLGFVVRRHGSGTFVRKRNHTGVPENRLREISEKSGLATVCLFDFDSDAPSQFDPARELSLGLCSDFVEARSGSSNAEILAGIRSRSGELGCAFQETLIVDAENNLLPLPVIVEHLKAMRVDGLIVSSKWKEYFNEALSMAFKKNVPLVCYTWPSTTEGDVSPLVQLNTDLALRRAIGFLAKEGYRSIQARTTPNDSFETGSINGCSSSFGVGATANWKLSETDASNCTTAARLISESGDGVGSNDGAAYAGNYSISLEHTNSRQRSTAGKLSYTNTKPSQLLCDNYQMRNVH